MKWIDDPNGTGGWWTCNWKDLVTGNSPDEKDIWYTKFTEDRFTGVVEGQCQGYLLEGDKDGPWVEYHDNGRLFQKGTYKNGKEHGPWVIYHGNGQLRTKGDYKNGKKVGTPWVEYNDMGTNKADIRPFQSNDP
jgi:antitoxin component YwqK of YwqJK toxin-antitoxin module